MRFSRKVAMVTGAGSGIGRQVARQLAAEGAALILLDRDADAVAAVAAALPDGARETISADVADPAAMARAVEIGLARFGRLDILVHSAGIGIERLFLETSPEEWRRLIDVDLSGTFFCCQAAARAMAKAGHGRIVTIASTAGIRGGTGRAAYGAAKGGVIALTKVMAVELAGHGITVNTLAPGAIETELVARMHSAETRRVYRAAIPADRYGTPEEVAHAALFLASDEAAYISGHVLAVDGGFLAAGIMHERTAP